ncbi:MAG: LysE family transporter [Bacteroidota bacterium]
MFLQGIQIGLGLAILVGPLIVLLVQLALEEGTTSSLLAGFGIWISDLLFILAAHFGMAYLQQVTDWPDFEPLVGTLGALVLFAVGLSMYFKPAPELVAGEEVQPRYFSALWKGFAINTFNPFPIFFWSTVALSLVHEQGLSNSQALSLYAGILCTIIFTDSLKIFSAGYLRRYLHPAKMKWVQRIGGSALVLFGLVLLLKVWV